MDVYFEQDGFLIDYNRLLLDEILTEYFKFTRSLLTPHVRVNFKNLHYVGTGIT